MPQLRPLFRRLDIYRRSLTPSAKQMQTTFSRQLRPCPLHSPSSHHVPRRLCRPHISRRHGAPLLRPPTHIGHGDLRPLVQVARLVRGRVRVRRRLEPWTCGRRRTAGLLAPRLRMVRGHGVSVLEGTGGVAVVSSALQLADPALPKDEKKRQASDGDDEAGEDVVVEPVQSKTEAAGGAQVSCCSRLAVGGSDDRTGRR